MRSASSDNDLREVQTQVKNEDLIRERRSQIVEAAVPLFIKHGYQKTTTRSIAQATGFSIGSLYEYVSTKDDVLYLVCMAIHAETEKGVTEALQRPAKGRGGLAEVIRGYFLVCDRISEHIRMMYQVTQFLPPKWQRKALDAELQITGMLIDTIRRLRDAGRLPPLTEPMITLLGHNISVFGHAWALNRGFLSQHFTIDQYIEHQTEFITGSLENQFRDTSS